MKYSVKKILFMLLFVFLCVYGSAYAITPDVCPGGSGDFNQDKKTDLIDFDIFRKEFTGESETKKSDANCDGVINLVDFNTWRVGFFNGVLPSVTAMQPTISQSTPSVTTKPTLEISPKISLLPTQPIPTGALLRIEEKDNGKNFTVKKREKFTVTLEHNPSTGFTWHITQIDASKLKKNNEVACETLPPTVMPGTPCMKLYEFETINTGQTKLQLEYKRIWEDKPPEKIFTVIFQIQ